MNWKNIKVSEDSTHFLLNKKPLFDKIFIEVLKFHSPGIAPVIDNSGAYHINTKGYEIYTNRYERTFGFYYCRAAVIENNQWFHIDEKGKRAYQKSFLWAGNFQEEICSVRNKDNQYFHIDLKGNRIYKNNYAYVGDYKDGVACVKLPNGFYRHIDNEGNFINEKSFLDLGVFHKSFAIAKDENGWFHINKQGKGLYLQRYAIIEPFYNGFALTTNFDGSKQIIDEKGTKVTNI